jgi:hypothetical protein
VTEGATLISSIVLKMLLHHNDLFIVDYSTLSTTLPHQ